jgi:hypothetical protein
VAVKKGGFMKSNILGMVLLVAAMSSTAAALGGKTPPTNNGSGYIQCAWYDLGKHEEHGNHLSEGECRQAHGTCQERCFDFEQVCTVEGVVIEIVQGSDGKPQRKDVITLFKGRDRDHRRAREMALRDCDYSYPRQDSCRVQSCSEEAIRIR